MGFFGPTKGTGGLQHHNFFIFDEKQRPKNIWFHGSPLISVLKTIHYNQSGTYLWAKGGGGAKDSHIICSAALESILNVDVATVNGGPWRKGTGGSVAYGWGTSKDECSWAMGGDLKLGEVGIDMEVINGLLCTVVGVIVRSSSLSNPLFSDRQS